MAIGLTVTDFRGAFRMREEKLKARGISLYIVVLEHGNLGHGFGDGYKFGRGDGSGVGASESIGVYRSGQGSGAGYCPGLGSGGGHGGGYGSGICKKGHGHHYEPAWTVIEHA